MLHIFALICERLGQQELAIDLLQRAIAVLESAYEKTEDAETEMQFAIANVNLGRVRLATSDFAGALEAFGVSLSLTKADDDNTPRTRILRVQAQFGSGLASFRSGDLESALSMFEMALEEVGGEEEFKDVRGHITVLLSQTLWAIGSEDARDTAKHQLLEWFVFPPLKLYGLQLICAAPLIMQHWCRSWKFAGYYYTGGDWDVIGR